MECINGAEHSMFAYNPGFMCSDFGITKEGGAISTKSIAKGATNLAKGALLGTLSREDAAHVLRVENHLKGRQNEDEEDEQRPDETDEEYADRMEEKRILELEYEQRRKEKNLKAKETRQNKRYRK